VASEEAARELLYLQASHATQAVPLDQVPAPQAKHDSVEFASQAYTSVASPQLVAISPSVAQGTVVEAVERRERDW